MFALNRIGYFYYTPPEQVYPEGGQARNKTATGQICSKFSQNTRQATNSTPEQQISAHLTNIKSQLKEPSWTDLAEQQAMALFSGIAQGAAPQLTKNLAAMYCIYSGIKDELNKGHTYLMSDEYRLAGNYLQNHPKQIELLKEIFGVNDSSQCSLLNTKNKYLDAIRGLYLEQEHHSPNVVIDFLYVVMLNLEKKS